MRTVTLFLLIGLISLSTNAQKIIEKNIDYNNQYIDIDVKFASLIEVKTWNKPNLYFKATIRTKEGKYLDAYELNVEESDNNISITAISEPVLEKFRGEWKQHQKNKQVHYFTTDDWYEFNYVIYVPKNAKFKINSINGDLTSEIIEGDFEADLVNGDIDIATYMGQLYLSTINGEIAVKMIDAHLVAETIHGDIYADENLKFTVDDRPVGQKISGTTGKGSNILHLNTINGNMYFRE